MAFSVLVDGKPVRVNGRLPLLPLRDVVLFPGMALPLFVGRAASVAAIRAAQQGNKLLFAAAQRRPEVTLPRRTDLYDVGVIVRVRQVLSLPDGTMRVLVEGVERARLDRLHGEDPNLEVATKLYPAPERPARPAEELLHEVKGIFLEYARLDRRIPEEVVLSVSSCDDPLTASYRMSAHLTMRLSARQELLECASAPERLHLLSRLLTSETEISRLGQRIESEGVPRVPRVPSTDEPRRPARRGWSRDADDGEAELAEYEGKIVAAKMPAAVREKARRELERLGKMAPLSPEATVARTYLDWMIALPWTKRTRDRTDVEAAQAILDEDHYGLATVKERIVEQIAVMQLAKGMRGPVLCLLGPPGVGKTSLGRSVARALNRRFVRMSLGGVRDEAEIRGHRRTYIGAMPGRILQAMRRAGTVNPVILLDEVDKLGLDYRGDPAAALLEVLDPEQNHAFNDHYLEVDYDLSRILFLTTANSASGIPPALRDRMEVIRLPGYLETEKLSIAEKFLLPKQRSACGLTPNDLMVSRDAMARVVREYTREAGVRGLEREIARVCRKAARRRATHRGEPTGYRVEVADVEQYLGIPRFVREEVARRDRIGVSTGLAWSEAGGALLQIEVGVLPGRGRLLLTGKLGQVMKESAHAALSCVRSRAAELGLDPLFHRTVDIHLHIPEGEVPKDGPSAGTAIALAMVSALLRVPTRDSVAVTGELTLRGQVLPVGGLSEKSIAALRAGVKTVLVPAGNERHLLEIPEEVRKGLTFVPVSTLDQVLRRALARHKGAGGAAVRTAEIRPTSLVLPATADVPAAQGTRARGLSRRRKAA